MATSQEINIIKRIFEQRPTEAVQSIANTINSLPNGIEITDERKAQLRNLVVSNLILDNRDFIIQFIGGGIASKIDRVLELRPDLSSDSTVGELIAALAPPATEEA